MKRDWRWAVLTCVYCWGFLSIGLVQGVLGTVLLFLARHAHVSEAAIGSLVVARSLGWVLGSGAVFFYCTPAHLTLG
jgi:hypothetical protein